MILGSLIIAYFFSGSQFFFRKSLASIHSNKQEKQLLCGKISYKTALGEKIHYRIFTQILTNGPYTLYPDFHLPEFGAYIEYFGMAGNPEYDKGIKTKEAMYSKMGLDMIPVYPWMFAENWQGYIMRELKNVTVQRYRKLMNKPYWSKTGSRSYRTSFRSSKPRFYR